MPKPDRQENVLDLLKGLRGLEPLKQLFWSELNYQRINQPLSRRGWTDTATKALADSSMMKYLMTQLNTEFKEGTRLEKPIRQNLRGQGHGP